VSDYEVEAQADRDEVRQFWKGLGIVVLVLWVLAGFVLGLPHLFMWACGLITPENESYWNGLGPWAIPLYAPAVVVALAWFYAVCRDIGKIWED
jgi:protein-S-isoprenylcysteine O-methyltransferase Ste14